LKLRNHPIYFRLDMNTNSFVLRHIGPREESVNEMVKTLGITSTDELVKKTIPEDILLENDLNLPEAMSEFDYLEHIQKMAVKNQSFKSYIGLGYHPSILPAVIQRNILENPGWYTAYTPYQAEISQGRLEALLNFQTMITELTGMDLANASLLDEGTAAAEAMIMLYNQRSRSQKKAEAISFFVSKELLPQTIEILNTRATPLGIRLFIGDHNEFEADEGFFGAILQYPANNGEIYDYTDFMKQAKASEIKVVVAADLLSLSLLKPPGEWGADVVVGTSQRFGIPMGYGGPHAAYFATGEQYKRCIPGRIIGVTKDQDGDRALRMALQTREQHIKREKATSNICTAQVLLAVMAGMYAVYHGPKGLQYIANKIHRLTSTLSKGLQEMGIQQVNKTYFDTLTLVVPDRESLKKVAEENGINFHYPGKQQVSISINETSQLEDINEILQCFADSLKKQVHSFDASLKSTLPEILKRQDSYMNSPVFNQYHSETELMRYIKKLERKDLSLNHSMISLGSCTMKLNAAAEMLPLSNPLWSNLHPFAPKKQAAGYHAVFGELEAALNEITGFAATSLQPNSGAQGEYAGLMVIRAFHKANGEAHRNICLIPSSAHGTNPASAVMAGMKVVVTKATEDGSIDVDDLREKALLHKENLGALMVTYPSTHGVFESAIREITNIIHDHGGQVYMDGANMNAQVGLTNPAKIGADICHLNLHKTFAIPHGGGGPGVGPICAAAHLAPFLPSNPVINTGGETPIPAISSAPWGSALVVLISYGYIKMLGKKGLKKATVNALLNANYIKARLETHYPILYTGDQDFSAHEMIVDFRNFKSAGITVTDIAKRLMDYGYHAPTVSFPVAGTMMIEPTESENKASLDRFCDALIAIRSEIDNNSELVKNAPHTEKMLTADQWHFSYTRTQAAYPLPYLRENKFWPAVRRVDEAYGDRNLICTCTPVTDYA